MLLLKTISRNLSRISLKLLRVNKVLLVQQVRKGLLVPQALPDWLVQAEPLD
jgi:hypothetical protein